MSRKPMYTRTGECNHVNQPRNTLKDGNCLEEYLIRFWDCNFSDGAIIG
jgi:hypothetical protein